MRLYSCRPLMKFKLPNLPLFPLKPKSHMASLVTVAEPQTGIRTPHSDQQLQEQEQQAWADTPPSKCLSSESRIERAWAHWTKLGQPKLIVAPMVDNSELPFRMLCRKYGADAAYTPMLHSRIFTETEKYRNQEFTTCKVTF